MCSDVIVVYSWMYLILIACFCRHHRRLRIRWCSHSGVWCWDLVGFVPVLITGWLVTAAAAFLFRVRVSRATGTFSCRAADVEAGSHRAALAGFGPVCWPSAGSGCRGCWGHRHSPASAHNVNLKMSKLCLTFCLSSGNVVLENLKVKENALVSR